MADTYAETVALVAELSKKSFADHKLTLEGPNEWRCGKPFTVIYSFRVLLRPGAVVVWGDLGEWILRHGDNDSLGWLRDAVHSSDYLLEKVQASKRPVEEFYAADALALLKNVSEIEDNHGPVVAQKVVEELEGEDAFSLTFEGWNRAWFDAGADEWNRVEYPSASSLWLVELLRKFVALESVSAGGGEEDRHGRPRS